MLIKFPPFSNKIKKPITYHVYHYLYLYVVISDRPEYILTNKGHHLQKKNEMK